MKIKKLLTLSLIYIRGDFNTRRVIEIKSRLIEYS